MDAKRDIKTIEESLKYLQGKEYISESTVSFFRDLIRMQSESKSRLHEDDTTFSISESEIKEKLRDGKPLISPEDMPLPPAHLKELFSNICTIMKSSETSDAGTVQKLIDAESNGDISLPIMTRKLLGHDKSYFNSLSMELNIGEDLLLFVALNLAKPFCEAAAEKITFAIGENEWLRHYCPVCGGAAQIARLEKDAGRKMLYCQLCGSEWRYLRIKCPFCCSEKQKYLRFLQVENSPYRVDFCDQCKRYIKTFDARKGGDSASVFLPSVEDLATTYLDFLAEREGYVRSCFFPPSVNRRKEKESKETIH